MSIGLAVAKVLHEQGFLVAVGARGARDEIRSYLATHDRVEGKDFLCVA